MQNVHVDLKANEPKMLTMSGLRMLVQASSVGSMLDFEFYAGGAVVSRVQGIGEGTKITPRQGFTSLKVTAPADGSADLIIMEGDVDIQLPINGVTIENGSLDPVPVNVDNWPQWGRQAATLSDNGPLPVGTNAVRVALGGASVVSVRVRNSGTTNIGLGGAGVKINSAAMLLAPGDIREETDALMADLYAVSDVDGGMVAVEVAKV